MSRKRITATAIEQVGGQYAMTSRFRHPSLSSYLVRSKRKENIFDTEEIAKLAEQTLSFVEQCGHKKEVILFVTTRREMVTLVRETAEALGLPYMVNRWIGGTLSNFRQIKGQVERLEQLRKERESGVWTKFTKKERVVMNRVVANLEAKFSGITSLTQLPSAVFILDTKKEQHAVAEANRVNIPIIGFSNANADISKIQHPIIANMQSRETTRFILKQVAEAYLEGAKQGGKTEEKQAE